MISVAEFCDRHGACKDGRDWALANCDSMLAAWQTLKSDWLVWVATRPGVLTDRELRLFLVFCARQVEHLLADQRSRDAILVAEKFANGEVTTAALDAARDAARVAANAASDAASDTAGVAALDAARVAANAASDAASDTAGDAAGDAAWVAALVAAGVAAWDAALAAARAAARDAQADWLRKNTRPNFEEVTE